MMEKDIHRKCLAVGIILLFVGTSVIPLTAQKTIEKPTSQMNTLSNDDYVLKSNSENNLKPRDTMDYYPGDMDTPLFNISVIINNSEIRIQAAWGLTSADFNSDGNMDFAVAYSTCPFYYSTFSIFYNNGNGNFTKDDVYTFHYDYIMSITSGDFDNDGDIDIIFSYNEYNQDWVYIYGFIRILFNDGTNHFPTSAQIAKRGTGIPFDPDGRINLHITSADYDMDGDLDLIAGDNSGNVEFYLNNGTANFTSAGIIYDYGLSGVKGLTWGVTSADFDGDGDIDFLVAAKVRDYFGHIWFKQNMMVESNHSTVFEPDPGIIIADINSSNCIQGTASLTSLDYNDDGNMDFIAGIGSKAYLYMNKGWIYEPFYICTLPDGSGGYSEVLTFGGMTSADYDNDGYMDVVLGGVQGFVRLLVNNHILAVITRPKNTYWYLFDEEQYPLFKYEGRLCIGKITIGVSELEELEKVEFYIDGRLRNSDVSPPYNFTWRLGNPLRHRHTIKIVAYGNDGKISEDEIRMWRFL